MPLCIYQNGPNLGRRTNAGEAVEGGTRLPAGGVQAGTATSEDSAAGSHKTEHALTLRSSCRAPRHLRKEVETYVRTKTYSGFIRCCPNLEATRVSFSRQWMINWSIQNVGRYSVLERNEPVSHGKTRRKPECVLLSEKSRSGKAV